MKFSELTKDHILEIVNLVYPYPDWIKSEIDIKYQPYDSSWLDDAQEYWFAKFDGITFGDKIDTYRLYIYPNLNLSLDVIRDNPDNFTEKDKTNLISGKYVLLGSFPIRNQHKIHKKFIEWGLESE